MNAQHTAGQELVHVAVSAIGRVVAGKPHFESHIRKYGATPTVIRLPYYVVRTNVSNHGERVQPGQKDWPTK